MKQIICAILTFLTLLSLLPGVVLASYTQTYDGEVLMAVNTNTSTGKKTLQLNPSDYIPPTGSVASVPAELYRVDPVLPTVHPGEPPQTAASYSAPMRAAAYMPGSSQRTFTDYNDNRHTLICLYIGTYCSVWGSTSDYAAIQISQTDARQIGQEFDRKFPQMQQYFGKEWYDADGDGKIALLCYDIDQDYRDDVDPAVTPKFFGDYTAGYFWSMDMAVNQTVNGVYYPDCSVDNRIDCVSIDTFPGMGAHYATPLDDIPYCYSTLFHELQHMLCYSYQVKDGPDAYFDDLEHYLNEAFSTAAEYLLYGIEAPVVKFRIDFFNGSNYIPGSALTYWNQLDARPNNNYVLSNYSNAFLFGQYLRTRYEQLHPGSGAQIYQEVLSRRNGNNADNTLAIVVELLETTEQELITDFWQAVYQRMDSGIYGFNGEDWADALRPPLVSITAGNTGIDNGGVLFCRLDGGSYETAPQNALTLRSLSADHAGPSVQSIRLTRTAADTGIVCITASTDCTLHYEVTQEHRSSVQQLTGTTALKAGTETTLTFSLTPGTTPKFYYGLQEQSSADTAALQELVFPIFDGDYKDVTEADWFYDAVSFASHYGIMNGTGSQQFKPRDASTRGQLVTMLYRLEGAPDVSGVQNPFRDLRNDAYYWDAVLWAAENGIVKGVTPELFCPDQPITRQQAVTMLYRYAETNGCDMSGATALNSFADHAQVSDYAVTPFRWAVSVDLIEGIANGNALCLCPLDKTNRAQLATMFQRYCLNILS